VSRKLSVLSLSVLFMVGITLGVMHEPVSAQGTGNDTIESTACRRTNCMFVFDCVDDPTWGDDEAIWQVVRVIPQKEAGARSREMVWEEASGEFQPFQFTVTWKGTLGVGTTTETAAIDADGTVHGTDNIRVHATSVTLCDGFSGQPPVQVTGTHGGSTCIEAIVYNFDVRLLYNGAEAQCYVNSHGRAHSENADLDAVPEAACGASATPWTFKTQFNTNLNCFQNTYIVRYQAP